MYMYMYIIIAKEFVRIYNNIKFITMLLLLIIIVLRSVCVCVRACVCVWSNT